MITTLFFKIQALPIIWALTNNKQTSLYSMLWSHIKEEFDNFMLETSMSDFEISSRAALKQHFPNIVTYGCWFHFCQAIWKNAVRLGVADKINNKTENPKSHRQIKKFMYLALLPAQDIIGAFNLLIKQNKLMYHNNKNFEAFYIYYKQQWLNREKPENISVYECDDKTNNFLESYHRDVKQKVGRNADMKSFLQGIIELVKVNRLHFMRIKMGEFYSPEKKKTQIEKEQQIFECLKKYECKEYNVLQFLDAITERNSQERESSMLPPELESMFITKVAVEDFSSEPIVFHH